MTTNELAIAIRSAVAALPERAREIFLLNRHAELSYREIAVRLGVSVKTVEFRMGCAPATRATFATCHESMVSPDRTICSSIASIATSLRTFTFDVTEPPASFGSHRSWSWLAMRGFRPRN